jgi:hypothetical protein
MATPFVHGANGANATNKTNGDDEIYNIEDELPLPNPPLVWNCVDYLTQLQRASDDATETDLIHALDHVGALLSARGYRWALTGALALVMHGCEERETAAVGCLPRVDGRKVSFGWNTRVVTHQTGLVVVCAA